MADDLDVAALQRLIERRKALTAKLEAQLAAAQAASLAPLAPLVPVAPVAPRVSAPFVRKLPKLVTPQAYRGLVVSDHSREVGLFSPRHRELAEQYRTVRDHEEWNKYWDPISKSFVAKSRKINGTRQYHMQLLRGEVAPPGGLYLDSRLIGVRDPFVPAHKVFEGQTLKKDYAHLRVKGGVLMEGGREVTVRCFLFTPMTYEDEHKVIQYVHSKAVYDSRVDLSLSYVVDPDGNYHQETRGLLFNTTEEALKPWLPYGRVWWLEGSQFPDYISLDAIKAAPIANAPSARKHAYSTLAEALDAFASYTSRGERVSAIQFRDSTVHSALPSTTLASLPHHGKPRMLYSNYLDARKAPAPTCLEDWIVPEGTQHLPTEGGAVVPLVLPADTGCGYKFIIDTFGPHFSRIKGKVEADRKKSRHHDVELTPTWLYEKIFHPGKSYDENDLGLSLEQLGLFFKRFRLSLFVIDVTGHLVEEACVMFWPSDLIKEEPSLASIVPKLEALDTHINPYSAFVVAHNNHLYPITDQPTINSLRKKSWDMNSFLWRDIPGLEENDEEEIVALAPSARFSLGKDDEAKPIFLEKMDDLATLDVMVPKKDKKGEPKKNRNGDILYHNRLRIAVPAKMTMALTDLVEKANYEPRVTMSGLGEILSLTIKVDGVSLSISAPHHLVPEPTVNDPLASLPTKEIFEQYSEHDSAFKAALCSKQTLSTYSPSLLHVFKRHPLTLPDGSHYPITPFYRTPLYYGNAHDGPVTAVDRIKSYTSLLLELDKVPVFTEFCEFEPFHYDKPFQQQQVTGTFIKDPLQPSSQEALDQLLQYAGVSRNEDWRSYSDKTLEGCVLSLRRKGRSEKDITHFLVEGVGQPPKRASRILDTSKFSERDRHSFYLVKREGTLFQDQVEHLILDQEYCLVTFDTWLLCRDFDCCETLGVIKPFNLVKTDIKKVIKALWDSTLPTDLKKFLPNKHVGICGKSDNRHSRTHLFQCAEEAHDIMGQLEDASLLVQQLGKHTFHFVTQEWRTPLIDGFMPIHYTVLDKQRRVLYEKAVEWGGGGKVKVLGVRTDCLYFAGHEPALDVPKRGTFDAIGSWHVEQAKDHPIKQHRAREFNGDWVPNLYNEPNVEELPILDEYDASEFASLFGRYNNILILAQIPGAGKTYALKAYMATLGPAALFVTPYNALADDLVKGSIPAHAAITFHRLLGLLAHGEEPEEEVDEKGKPKKTSGHDISAVSHIVFDEVFCYNPVMLGQLKRWLDKNAEMADGTPRKFYATGDCNQNQPIYASCLSRLEMKDYYRRAVNSIFPRQINLQVCKRVSKDQQARIVAIKNDVLNSPKSLLKICDEYFKPIRSLGEVRGRSVCYLNETARVVNTFKERRMGEMLEQQGEELVRIGQHIYYYGQTLRARKFNKHPRIYINYTYTVSGFERKDGEVTGILLDEIKEKVWSPALVKHIFQSDFANTCHSLQGMTADGGVTIFDIDLWCAETNREWFYTALTRTNDLDAVYFYDPAAGPVSNLPVVKREDFLAAMVEKLRGYQDQDTAAERTWEDGEFMDSDTILALYKSQEGRCAHCSEWLPPRWKDKDTNQPTIDRIDNSLAHVKGNCVLSCLRCNVTRH